MPLNYKASTNYSTARLNLLTLVLPDLTYYLAELTNTTRLNCYTTSIKSFTIYFPTGTEFVNQTLREFYENVGISHQTFVAGTPQQNDVVERRNQTLIEAARTMLIVSKAPLFLWAEAINKAYYTQNRSLIHLQYNKTPYELMQDKKPDLSLFHVFGALWYPTNDNDDLGKLDAKADIAMASSSGPRLHSMTLATSSLGLVPNTISQQPCIPPNRDDYDHLFQPIFDEYFNPPSIVVTPVQDAVALRAVVLADSPVSTSINQDALSTSIPSTQEQEHSLTISQGFEESPKTPTLRDDPLHESLHKESTSQGSSSNVRQIHTPFKHLEPKNFKQAMTELSWIDAMQEEIHEFERLQVSKLVSCPDKVLLIKLKWIYKVKTDEFGGVIKTKARLVTQGVRQEKGIDFEE
ncbi:retrovirus-related pol polyprotein from transposon TNT 1-94 [Tanacetum coccineum]|uniref:Retrovirus-related pol polyprotein from transposon TNT 1-94 n=1 Tax=Tanacetum coccineum TaxID=301880 RepID=A0ABQ4YLQ8_9ASTR